MTAKVIVAALVMVLIVIIVVGSVILLRGESYSISVPIPPGYMDADESLYRIINEFAAYDDDESKLDHFFINDSMTSFVMVFNTPLLPDEVPPSDPDEMERYLEEQREELIESFDVIDSLDGLLFNPTLDIIEFETMRLGCGETALRVDMKISDNTKTMRAGVLMVAKGRTGFVVMAIGLTGQDLRDTMDHLAQSITFNK